MDGERQVEEQPQDPQGDPSGATIDVVIPAPEDQPQQGAAQQPSPPDVVGSSSAGASAPGSSSAEAGVPGSSSAEASASAPEESSAEAMDDDDSPALSHEGIPIPRGPADHHATITAILRRDPVLRLRVIDHLIEEEDGDTAARTQGNGA